MIIKGTSPYKCITVRVRFDLCSVDIQSFQCDKPFFFQSSKKLVIQVIQDISGKLMIYKIIKSVDRDAFMSVGSVTGVYGKGFDQIKK